MFTANTYNPDSQPLGFFKGHAVYLATVLVAVHVASMLIGVVSPAGYAKALVFAPGSIGNWSQIWRWVTYAFVQSPSIWFVVEMYFLYRFGIEIEKVFGRTVLAKLYAGLILLPPVLVTVLYSMTNGMGYPLAGTSFSHFCLFVAFCMLYPGALMFCSLPWLTLKLAASVFLAVTVLTDLADRQFIHLGLLLANLGLTYGVLRRAGLTPRFEKMAEALRDALPAPRAKSAPEGRRPALESGVASAKKASRYYEPKIKPKVDLAPERKVVEEIDSILEKIGRTGMDSLTEAERALLQRASSKLKDTD